jgi:hypothetical protein
MKKIKISTPSRQGGKDAKILRAKNSAAWRFS